MNEVYKNLKEEPFIMVAGEVHNSNSSTSEAMKRVWEKADALCLNTLLLPVSWEMIEPEEGVFQFDIVDELITQAREHKKHIVFLWFGAWKNAQCYYAPSWVKTDLKRFKRAEVEKGKKKTNLANFHGMSYTTLSYMCEETCMADAAAFSQLMAHIRKIDEKEKTVLMVQVENETGLQGVAREQSDEADRVFADQVPETLIQYLKEHTEEMAEDVRKIVQSAPSEGSWKDVFADVAEEMFSAYHIASYVERVASAGKAVYSIPMAVNCWLDKGQKPGEYPSGGPVARMMEVWKYCAPHIDVIAPDIYVQNFCEVCDMYTKMENPLMIPETAAHGHAGPRLVYTIGHYHALCFAPFGFEDLGEPIGDVSAYLFGVDVNDPLMLTPQSVEEYAWYAKTIQDMMPLLTKNYGTSNLQAVIGEREQELTMHFDQYGFRIITNHPFITRKDGVCLALRETDDTFYLIANACMIVPFSENLNMPNTDILDLEEGYFENGQWKVACRLNGDEVATFRLDKPTLLKIRLFHY